MASTLTSSIAHRHVPAKYLHEGVTPVVAKFVYSPTNAAHGATLSVSSVIKMIKIPNGATVLDGYVYGGVGTGITALVGSTLLTAAGASATQAPSRFTAAIPFEVSASQSDGNYQYTTLDITNVEIQSTTATFVAFAMIAKDGIRNL